MEIRHTSLEELAVVMEIYNNARLFMRNNGNFSQWVNGYPGPELIKQDIERGDSYVCQDRGQIVGVFTFFRGTEPTYQNIYNGSWLNEEPYGVIHRIASFHSRKGVATQCLDWCQAQWGNIRIDTHRDNVVMQNFLLKNNFEYCGIIYLEDGSERLAYQKTTIQL